MKNKDKPTKFGMQLKQSRKKQKITAEKLAKKAEIDRTYVSKVENHEHLPSYDVAQKLSEVLDDMALMDTYMSEKHPQSTSFILDAFKNKGLDQKILGLIREGKSDAEIFEYFIEKSENKTDSDTIKNLKNLIKECRSVVSLSNKTSSSLKISIHSFD